MDHEWQWPAVGGLVTLLTAAFGRLVYTRRRNSDAVLDAVDSTSTVYVSNLIANWQAAEKLAKTNHEMYVVELRRADALQALVISLQSELGDVRRQVKRLTEIVISDHPEFAQVLRRTGFGELDGASSGTAP